MPKHWSHGNYGRGGIMEKLRKYFLTVLNIICEHITLFATIIGSAFIVIDSQIRQYSVETLLLWIISLLGLIATAIASEKYFKLNRIEKNIKYVLKGIDNANVNLDEFFFTRKELEPLEERMKNANSIFLSGGSLVRLSDEYYAYFEKKLKENCRMEVIMVRPFTKGADLLCKNVVYETEDYNAYSKRIEESLNRFFSLQENFPQLVKIRLTENTPPFGIVATNLEADSANVKVELYSYAIPTRERMQFFVNKSDEKIFAFFTKQIDTLRLASEEVVKSDYEFHNT